MAELAWLGCLLLIGNDRPGGNLCKLSGYNISLLLRSQYQYQCICLSRASESFRIRLAEPQVWATQPSESWWAFVGECTSRGHYSRRRLH